MGRSRRRLRPSSQALARRLPVSGGFARSLIVILLVAVIVAIFATRGNGGSDPPLPVGADARVVAAEARQERALDARRREIAAYRQFVWNCEDELGAPRSKAGASVWALRRDVAYRTRIRDLWKGRYVGCVTVLGRRTIPATGDWGTAVAIVQRIYPGTAGWLLRCSSGEGGHGGWVPYHAYGNHYYAGYEKLDAVGGWMQFRPSTFYGYVRKAFSDARRRGFILDRTYESWLSPLGQAVTAAYMRFVGLSPIHWKPSEDRNCA